ncbi:uncharacterized protein [Onthophagus taurus]|uniref:uncharacterized protein n=1 Tax=Onthophagus taurus TaxID=166361 RepID=UPI0039BEA520
MKMGSLDESSSPMEQVSLDLIFTRIAHQLSEYESKYEEEEHPRVFRTANAGEEFNFFKPRNADTIYYCLIMDPNCAEELATSLIEKYELDDKAATAEMIQFFADVAGIQSIKINEYFGICDYNQILKRMIDKIPTNYQDSGYLLIKEDAWIKKVTSIFTKFVKICVHKSEQKGSLFKNIFSELFEFLKVFCKSKVQVFKHTGLFFAINFSIAIGKIARGHAFVLSKFRDIADYSDYYRTQLESKIKCCETELNLCLQYSRFLATIILWENKVYYHGMKLYYKLYVTSLPLLYISGDDVVKNGYVSSLVYYLNYQVTDQITLILIESVIKMLKDERNMFNEVNSSKIIHELYGMTLAKNLKIGASALRALCAATERYFPFISEELQSKLFPIMYNKNCVLAKEAGKFFMLSQRKINADVKGILIDMVNYRICLPMYKNVPEDFVESIIDEAHELSDFTMITEMSLRNDLDLDFNQEVVLLEIFAHAVIIKMTGTSLKPRVDSKEISYNPEEVVEILNQILPSLHRLFQKYSTETQCLNNLLLIMNKIPLNDVNLTQFHDKLYQIIKLYPKLFEHTNDKILLLSISENLRHFSSESSPIHTLSSATVQCITEKVLAEYESDFHSTWNDNVQYHISGVLAKLAALRKFHPPMENEIFTPLRQLNECNEKVVVNELEYEAYFLCQKVNKYLQNELGMSSIHEMYDSFCDGLCQILTTLKSMESFTILLNCFVDVHVSLKTIRNELKNSLTEDQVEIICVSIKKKLENNDEDSMSLVTKFLNSTNAVTNSIALYILALFNKFHSFYGDIYESMLVTAFKVSPNEMCAVITETVLREITNFESGLCTACENFTEIEELSARYFSAIPKKFVPTAAIACIELGAKYPSYSSLLKVVNSLCVEQVITKDNWKGLARILRTRKFPSEKQEEQANSLLVILEEK